MEKIIAATFDIADQKCKMYNALEWHNFIADTREYLADGGTITYLPYDWKAEMVGRVGYWKPMGDPTDEEIGADDDYETYS